VAAPSTIAAPETVRATSYVAPLREGGSLPGLVEADDDGLYVVKFRGAGQGPKALVAETLAGEIGRAIGLPVPRLVFVDVDPVFARAEPDPEIQDLVDASAGLNLGLDYLPGALAFDADVGRELDPDLAAAIVWFDALITNVDRTPRNPNLLVWHGRLWMIDHGAAFYLHHGSWPIAELAQRPFPAIREHVLLPFASSILDADARLAPLLDRAALDAVTALLPDTWLTEPDARAEYAAYLERRLEQPRGFAEEAEHARSGA
jgi:hypothetical protein